MTIYRASGLNEVALLQYAKVMAESIEHGAVLCLEGDLGAGKSTFARGWTRAVTAEVDIPSPTFSIVQEYQCLRNSIMLYHMDLYRLASAEDLEELGFEEMLNNGICLIEWASKIPEAMHNTLLPLAILRFDFCGTDRRDMQLESQHHLWSNLAESLGMEAINADTI